MLPVFKETVEELFREALVKVVFATETLSLGINMPAKTVVIESLWKFSGEKHELLTPGEYTQLTGRAGRRGIDDRGFAVVVQQPDVDFETVSGLASRRTYELRSSFRPSYNMAVNLVRNYSPEQAHHLLNSSFAQFRADRSVVSVERKLERNRAALLGYQPHVQCHLGDFGEYWDLRERAVKARARSHRTDAEDLDEVVRQALAHLRLGDVIYLPGSRRRGLAVVLSHGRKASPMVLTQDRKLVRLNPGHFESPPRRIAHVQLPKGSTRGRRFREELAGSLTELRVPPPPAEGRRPNVAGLAEAERLERLAEEHPCHECPDREEHERWARRASKLRADIAKDEGEIRRKTGTLASAFDRVLSVLHDLEYVDA